MMNGLNVRTHALLNKIAAERGDHAALIGAAASSFVGLVWYTAMRASKPEYEEQAKGLLGPLYALVESEFTEDQFQELVDACAGDLNEMAEQSEGKVH